jgi:hypothetical protein
MDIVVNLYASGEKGKLEDYLDGGGLERVLVSFLHSTLKTEGQIDVRYPNVTEAICVDLHIGEANCGT